ncbi:MAG: N-acetyl sugar amidotransferase, partial [Acidimicrobiaceae bacterium]
MVKFPKSRKIDFTEFQTSSDSRAAKYGLPPKVTFCQRCVTSNQKPISAIEFQHTAASVKQAIHLDDTDICDACRVTEKKASIDWQTREEELRALCDKHRSTDGSYDCLVPGSGGKD